MTNNMSLLNVLEQDRPVIEMAQIRLIGLYDRLKKKGGWRAVADKRKVSNVAYVHNLVFKGIVPKSPDMRRRLFLPRLLPSECKPKKERKPTPKVWESPESYLRKVKS